MSVQFAMRLPKSSSAERAAEALCDTVDPLVEALAQLVLAGPGPAAAVVEGPAALTVRRRGLLGELIGSGLLGQAVAAAPHRHKLNSTFNAAVTLICVVVGCLFPDLGYDQVIVTAFAMPGIRRPGRDLPSGAAYSKARARLGEDAARILFELHAAGGDDPGIGGRAFGLELTAFDGTTLEMFPDADLAEEFGVPTGGTKPKLRLVALMQTGTRRWQAAAIGGYTTGENTLVDDLTHALKKDTLNLCDRGFFSMDRWIRFSATGAHLLWRVKNSNSSLPAKAIKDLPDGSQLVRLHESAGMRRTRRRDIGGHNSSDRDTPPLPDTLARLITFTICTRTPRGTTKTTTIRLLTTLLDADTYPADQLARLYAERWQIEIGYLHLKSTLRGDRRMLRGRSTTLVRQEVWANLLAYNLITSLAADCAALAGLDPDVFNITALISAMRRHLQTDIPCRNCGHHTSGEQALADLVADVLAQPRNRTGRGRTSGRTAKQRATMHTEPASYTLTIQTSNLPKLHEGPGS